MTAGRPGRDRAARGSPRQSQWPGEDWPLAGGLVAGLLADAVLGDQRRGHPVAGFGALMRQIERRSYADSKARGAALAGAGVVLAAGPALVAARRWRDPAARLALTAAYTWTVLGSRSLMLAAEEIRLALAGADIPRARLLLPGLCGRDAGHLDTTRICAAVIESVAENTSDAIVAPLLWGALAGPGGLAGYRAVNTLDAMVGHRGPRYGRFGWASARLDDVANAAPARLTALLAAACAAVVSGSPGEAWQAALRDGPGHPSPNAGWCEAAFAGALGVRLGGPVSYRGRDERRPALGSGRPPVPGDIGRAVRLSRVVTATAAGAAAALALVPG